MREGEYEYIHEFKERINEIMSLQKKHHQIIDSNEHNPLIAPIKFHFTGVHFQNGRLTIRYILPFNSTLGDQCPSC